MARLPKINAALIVPVLALLATGCSTTQHSQSGTYADDFYAVQEVDASDGINSDEAYVIAKAFFWSNISGCGIPLEPEDKGEHWSSKTYIGVGGMPGAPIIIDKKTGAVSWGHEIETLTLEELKKSASDILARTGE